MARIRSIKPDFPQSESMGRVSRESRLLFVLLWTICDDFGKTRGNSRILASLLFPYDDDAPKHIDKWLTELERENCIVRYVADGNTYLEILNWLKHQRIDKPTASKIPSFESDSEIFAKVSEDVEKVCLGREGNRKGIGKGIGKDKDIYGHFKNVLLTEGECQKLSEKFGNDRSLERIERLSQYIASKGVKYKSHYATILSWASKDVTTSKVTNLRTFEQIKMDNTRQAMADFVGEDDDTRGQEAIRGTDGRAISGIRQGCQQGNHGNLLSIPV